MNARRTWGCKHDKDRTALPGGRVHCGTCGKTFTSPKARVQHGTLRGFSRHKRTRSGNWPWPAEPGTCGCREARREYETVIHALPGNTALRHARDASRQAALLSLRRQFPAEYQRHYAAQMAARGLPAAGDSVPVPVWDELVARLVKTALGVDEHEASGRVREGWAGPKEREVVRLVARLRAVLAAAGRRPPGA